MNVRFIQYRVSGERLVPGQYRGRGQLCIAVYNSDWTSRTIHDGRGKYDRAVFLMQDGQIETWEFEN